MNTLKAGAVAPAFTLQNQYGEAVALQEKLQQHKVLVYFYPKALTPGCTVQACGLRDSKAELAALGVVVLGISTDPVAKLHKFMEKQQLNFDLLSDENHAVADAFGVWGEKKFMGKVYDGLHRISFLIAQDGTIETVFDKFKTKDHHEVVLNYLKG
ncbi:thioredoxin-dependent thiol peroxidase [Shewanella dokdonensis]|uniref:thioredoxin-dependent peroxiredoxin n=1 Tax=Shewanella dokdonensis TaxID=712036 RepID=A0ABX8DFP3_9GAMM|nr:thioredoxin-dependent thiol peroxidase [Shewanella dokdonensis]MCL1073055.1 thioredoxin-dependent thiol peroxidase [Shewanella dokdonensis]QVK23046.1 thioredoxin-dependent thiol peroxidase [Shewanella dokdonensis]